MTRQLGQIRRGNSFGSFPASHAAITPEMRTKQILELASQGHEQFVNGEYNKAMKTYTEVLRKSAESSDRHASTRVLLNIGNVHLQRGETSKSIQAFAQALRLARTMVSDRSDGIDLTTKLSLVADALQNIATVQLERGDVRQALVKNSEALSLRRSCLESKIEGGENQGIKMEDNEDIDRILLDISEVLNNIGMCSEKDGKYAGAKSAYEESLQIRSSILGKRHLLVAESLLIAMPAVRSCRGQPRQQDSSVSPNSAMRKNLCRSV